jgi:hypothetical protein
MRSQANLPGRQTSQTPPPFAYPAVPFYAERARFVKRGSRTRVPITSVIER